MIDSRLVDTIQVPIIPHNRISLGVALIESGLHKCINSCSELAQGLRSKGAHLDLGIRGIRGIWVRFCALSAPRSTLRIVQNQNQVPLDLWWIYGGFMVDLWWIYGRFMVDLWWIYGGFMVVGKSFST